MVALVVTVLLIFSVTLPLPCSGLVCECTEDCTGESTCEGAVCYAQHYSDVSGMHWNLRKGCLDTLSSVICQYTKSDTHTSACCNDTDHCNDNLVQTTSPPSLSCNCNGNRRCDDNGQCTLRSTKHSCYTVLRRLGSVIVYERGCVKKCMEYHNEDEIRTCCRGNMCNDEAIPTTWPPVSSTAVSTITPTITPTKISYTPPSLNEGTAATPAPPTSDSATPGVSIFEQPTTLDPQRPTQLICHCSGCRDGVTTCLAAVACASHVVETVKMAWCIQEEFSCRNNTFQLNCCYNDYCNGPDKPNQGLLCDDEDTEASGSGGCNSAELTAKSEEHAEEIANYQQVMKEK